MRTGTVKEIQRQANDHSQAQYVEPVSGFTASDAERPMEDLHELYFRFSITAAKEGFDEEFVSDIANTYSELRLFLRQIIYNSEKFNELKAGKPVQ